MISYPLADQVLPVATTTFGARLNICGRVWCEIGSTSAKNDLYLIVVLFNSFITNKSIVYYLEILARAVENELFGNVVTSGRIYPVERLGIIVLPVTISNMGISSSRSCMSNSCRRHDTSSFVGGLW